MEYKEFITKVRRLNQPRKSTVSGSIGVYHIYKWIRKNKWLDIGTHLTEHLFYTIIREINKNLGALLALGVDIKLPHQMGVLEIRKTPSIVKFKEGRLVTNLPIDWKATVELWYNDEEAFNNKTIIRKEWKEIYRITYNKGRAKYNNKLFFKFRPNREIKKALQHNAELNKIEAFLKQW